MKYIVYLLLLSSTIKAQTYSGGIYVESGTENFGIGIDLYIIPDSSVAVTVGLAWASEYGKKEVPGTFAYTSPNPMSWWQDRGEHETKKTYPGLAVGMLLFRTLHISALVDYTKFEKYKIWYSPVIMAEFNTKAEDVTKFGFGAGIQCKFTSNSMLGFSYHNARGFALRYTFTAL